MVGSLWWKKLLKSWLGYKMKQEREGDQGPSILFQHTPPIMGRPPLGSIAFNTA
jgi:hypothetical protein